MVRLENKITKKLAKEGKISNMPMKNSYKIYLSTVKRMDAYIIRLIKKTHASYIAARKVIFNS